MEGFKIFNASAGSGKTYQLTKYYLRLILSNIHAQSFRRILALTFTNKAVAEMKERILDSLWVFGDPKISKTENTLFLELQKELGISYKELEKKCATTLKLLLHNYDFFEISTIDKFTHRVIKTFARDLKIAQNFEVELDGDLLLDEAIGRLLQKLSRDEKLKRVLVDFALQKVDASKSWNIVYDLKEIGKLLFDENHFAHLQEFKNKSLDDFEPLKKLLSQQMDNLSEVTSELAQKALNTIEIRGFEHADFNRETLPNHFKKIVAGERNSKLYANKLEEGLINGSLLLKKIAKDGTALHAELLAIFLEIKRHILEYLFIKNAYKNVLPLSILNEIAKEVSKLQEERGFLHISEFNKLISNEVANQPVPYIYERLGERYRHYFIDEFQDTSKMQWQNLIPLIGNALETEDLNGDKGSLMLVGDAKQSIYRWRGGNPEQFLGLNDLSESPFSVAPEISLLDTNWRSYSQVVEFNNDFFSFVSDYLNEVRFSQLYKQQSQQKTNQNKGGYIELNFVTQNEEQIEDDYSKNVLDTILKIIEKGHSYNDICILVRKNKHGIVLADYLSEKNIPLISSEALLLQNNMEVQFLVNLLRFLNNPSEKTLHFEVLEYLFNNRSDKHDRIHDILGHLPEFLESNYGYLIDNEVGFSVLDILERAIMAFDLVSKCGAHVIHFLDIALEFSQKQNVSIHGFLNYWDLKKKGLAISSPAHQNAVQIMSIHKSKGLEFPFVIYPFADDKINARLHEQKVWVPLSENNNTAFNKVLVNTTKELEHYSSASATIYTSENHLSELDDFNVLYVALTRAVQGLFIFTKSSRSTTYGKLFEEYLCYKNLWNPDISHFSFGKFSNNTSIITNEISVQNIPYIYNVSNDGPQLAITSQSLWDNEKQDSKNWGTLIHSILAEINTKNDVASAIEKSLKKGDLEQDQIEEVNSILLGIVTHPELSKFYSDGSTSMNEVELLDVEGNIYRPDRLNLEGNLVTLIDYKTGTIKPEHKAQLELYSELIKEAESDLIVDKKILIYIGETIEPVFI